MWPLGSEECYVSVDVEADGPVPGLHSMLSVGAAAFTSDGELGETFSANLEQLPEASEDVRTMRWWASQSAAWRACRADPEPPRRAMRRFAAWLERQRRAVGLPVMVAFPAAYDATWVRWYFYRFVGDDPFRRRAIDVKTLAMVALGTGYTGAQRSCMPRHWRSSAPHTHVALDDAVQQGEMFMNIVRALNAQRGDVAVVAPSADAARPSPAMS